MTSGENEGARGGIRGVTMREVRSSWFCGESLRMSARAWRACEWRDSLQHALRRELKKWSLRTCDLTTTGALLAKPNSIKHLVTPLASNPFWFAIFPLPAPPTNILMSEMTSPALIVFCSDQDWNAKVAREVGERAFGRGKRRRGARRGMQEVSRK